MFSNKDKFKLIKSKYPYMIFSLDFKLTTSYIIKYIILFTKLKTGFRIEVTCRRTCQAIFMLNLWTGLYFKLLRFLGRKLQNRFR